MIGAQNSTAYIAGRQSKVALPVDPRRREKYTTADSPSKQACQGHYIQDLRQANKALHVSDEKFQQPWEPISLPKSDTLAQSAPR
jgi:hypothetical protein